VPETAYLAVVMKGIHVSICLGYRTVPSGDAGTSLHRITSIRCVRSLTISRSTIHRHTIQHDHLSQLPLSVRDRSVEELLSHPGIYLCEDLL